MVHVCHYLLASSGDRPYQDVGTRTDLIHHLASGHHIEKPEKMTQFV